MTRMEKSELTAIDNITLTALEDVCIFKHDAGVFPPLATMEEIINSIKPEILDSLRHLYQAGLITHNQSVNKKSLFGIKNMESNND